MSGDPVPERFVRERGVRAGVRRLFRLPLRTAAVARDDADDELDAFVDARVEHLVARGMTPAAARAEALRRLGAPLDEVRASLRRSAQRRERTLGVREWLAGFADDLRYAARGLVREPLFSAFAVLALALGIGANAAMYGVVDRLLLRGPAHVREPDRVVRMYSTAREPGGEVATTAAFDYRAYAKLLVSSRAFAGLAMQMNDRRAALLGDGASARPVSSARGTANLMSVLGARPVLGRFFTPEEQEADAPPPVVVLGHGIWRADFGGDSGIVGRTITIGGSPVTVVGVAPEGFTGADLKRVDLWHPLAAKTGSSAPPWGRRGPMIVARLRPGVAADDAARDATDAYRRSYDGDEPRHAEASITVGPLHFGNDGTESTEARVARWLAGVSAIVLLVACANIVNLLLARAVRRRREVAVRLALGAGRARLARLLLASSLLLAGLGGVAGLVVAFASGTMVRRVLLPEVDWTSGPVDARVLLFSLVAAIVTGVAIGVLPAIRAGRADVVSALKAGARAGGGGPSMTRATLMVAQTTLAMLLLVGAGLFVRSLDRVRRLDFGVDPDRVVVLGMRWPSAPPSASEADEVREERRRAAFARQVVDALAATPGVEHAAVAAGIPFGFAFAPPLRLPGRDSLPRLSGGFGSPDVSAVSADYFATMGTRLVRGRTFTAADRAGSEPVAVVSETMASVLWPGADAVGQCLLVDESTTCTRVAGVVEDVRRNRIVEDPQMRYYLPIDQYSELPAPDLVVRPRGDAEAAIPMLRARLREIDPTILFVDATTLQERIDPQTRSWRIGAMMFSLFAVLSLVVAAIGTFAVVAYVVEQRRHDIAVRVALGADTRHVVGSVLRGALVATGIGVALGALLALAGGRLAEPLLFETSARDSLVLGVVAGVLVLVSVLASTIPALRARRVDPISALRDE